MEKLSCQIYRAITKEEKKFRKRKQKHDYFEGSNIVIKTIATAFESTQEDTETAVG